MSTTDFTAMGLLRTLSEMVSDRVTSPIVVVYNPDGTQNLDPSKIPDRTMTRNQLTQTSNSRAGQIYDIRNDPKSTQLQHRHTLFLTYGVQERMWQSLLERMARILKNAVERKVFISSCVNPSDNANVVMNFVWKDDNLPYEHYVKSANELYCSDIPYAYPFNRTHRRPTIWRIFL